MARGVGKGMEELNIELDREKYQQLLTLTLTFILDPERHFA